MVLGLLTEFLMLCVLIRFHKIVWVIISLLFINFVGVVSTWLVESHYKSGQLKHQSMPRASSEGKPALHACHCVPSSLFSSRGPLSVTIQQISGASGCQCVGHIDKTVRTDECFHVTSRQPFWSPKPILWKLNFFLMLTLSFVPRNLHCCWPCQWKR